MNTLERSLLDCPRIPVPRPRSWSGPSFAGAPRSATRPSRTSRRRGRDLTRCNDVDSPERGCMCANWSSAASPRCVGCRVRRKCAAKAIRTVVERYVAEGLRSNLALQSETLEVEKAAQALAAARARFFPEVSLQARYTRAEGGREFTMPIGDGAQSGLFDAERAARGAGQPAPFPQHLGRQRAIPARRRTGHAPRRASAALCAGDSRRGARAARAARREQLQSHGVRARSAPRHHESPISTG